MTTSKDGQPRCCAVIKPSKTGWTRQCDKPATGTCNGKPYCTTHNPDKVAERGQAKMNQWRKEWDEKALARTKQAKRNELFGPLVLVLGAIIHDLPTNKDWLDPQTEAQAKALLDEAKACL